LEPRAGFEPATYKLAYSFEKDTKTFATIIIALRSTAKVGEMEFGGSCINP